MDSAWIGVIGTGVGVLVGGAATSGSAFALERRRESRTLRAAARLVQQEFQDGMGSALQIHLFNTDQLVTRKIEVREDAWLAHQARLAEELHPADWQTLTLAVEERRRFEAWLGDRESIYADDYTQTVVSNFVFKANQGWDALAKAAGFRRATRKRLRAAHAAGIEDVETTPDAALSEQG